MKAEEIERIKRGVVNAIAKAPGNAILHDLERSILTVEKYMAVLENIAQVPCCDEICIAPCASERAMAALRSTTDSSKT